MNRKLTAVTALLLSAAVFCGCRRNDGTKEQDIFTKTLPVETEYRPDPPANDGSTSTETLPPDPNSPTEPPFSFDPAEAAEPTQDLILVHILDNTDLDTTHTQTVNCFDKAGRVYRMRNPIDPYGNWYKTVQEEMQAGCEPVNQLGDVERDTLRYLANHAAEYAAAPVVEKRLPSVTATRWVYVIGSDNKPVLLAKYDDTSVWVDNSEVIAFANWFRFFYHPKFTFGE